MKKRLEDNKIYLEYLAVVLAFIGSIFAYVALTSQLDQQNNSKVSQVKEKYY